MLATRWFSSLLLLVFWVAAFKGSDAPAPQAALEACPSSGTIHADVGAPAGDRAGPYGVVPHAVPATPPAAQPVGSEGPAGFGSPVCSVRAAVPRLPQRARAPLRRAAARSAAVRPALRSFLSHPSTAPPPVA